MFMFPPEQNLAVEKENKSSLEIIRQGGGLLYAKIIRVNILCCVPQIALYATLISTTSFKMLQ
jgi:hypothetical protein